MKGNCEARATDVRPSFAVATAAPFGPAVVDHAGPGPGEEWAVAPTAPAVTGTADYGAATEASRVADVAVIGAGYVGLATAAMMSAWGCRVECFDRDTAKVALLAAGRCPIIEPRLPDLLRTGLGSGTISFGTRIDVSRAEVVFLCVGTPPEDDGRARLTDLFDAVEAIADSMQPGVTVVVKSTVPVGTCDRVEELLATRASHDSFTVLSNPEFLRQGSAIADTERPDRIVIGARRRSDADVLARIYEITGAPIQVMDRRSAELAKYAANAFLATRLSLINEVANVAEAVGADITRVAEAIGMDRRIGSQFLQAGIGYGGSCLPKDISALRHFARAAGCPTPLLDSVAEVNYQQSRRFVSRMETALGGLAGKTIGLLGVAFKPHTGDARGSVSLEVVRLLEEKDAHVRAYDPAAMPDAAARLTNGTYLAANAYDACTGVDAIAIATEWPQFASLDWLRLREIAHGRTIFDGRNLLDPALPRSMGFAYYGIGRSGSGPLAPETASERLTVPLRLNVPARAPRFLLYSHDALGMGHTRRNLLVAAALAASHPEAAVMVATGVHDIGLLGVPQAVEVLKLPSLRKVANGHYAARRLGLPPEEILALRSELLTAAVNSFRPDIMIVDQHPLGAGGELQSALLALRANGGKAVLGLRDILDSPETVAQEWGPQAFDARIVAHYSRVLVYGQQEVFDPIREYGFSTSLAEMVRFCGYAANPPSGNSPGIPLAGDQTVVVGTVGGGEDGADLLDVFIAASEGMPWRAIAVAGPYAPPEQVVALQCQAAQAGVEFHAQVDQLGDWFGSIDALVCMGGYNTLVEAISAGASAVCLPRTVPRTEQLIRARAFSRLGLMRLIEPQDVSVERLRREVTAALDSRRLGPNEGTSVRLDLDGAASAAREICSLIDADAVPHAEHWNEGAYHVVR